MIVQNLVFYIIIFSNAKIINSDQKQKRLITDDVTMSSFIKLLNTLIRVNEERIQAIQKISTLEDYLLTKHGEKFDEYYDSEETKVNRTIEVNESPVQPVRSFYEKIKGQSTGKAISTSKRKSALRTDLSTSDDDTDDSSSDEDSSDDD